MATQRVIPNLSIKSDTWSGYCEDCGPYSSGKVLISLENQLVLTLNYDGHIGGSSENWDGEELTLYATCLALLGYSVNIPGEVSPLPTLPNENQFRSLQQIDIAVNRKNYPGSLDCEATTYISYAKIPELEREACVELVFAPQYSNNSQIPIWEDGAPILRAVLSQIANVTMT